MIKRKNVADEIAEGLQRKILETDLKEGDRLPSHEELAQEKRKSPMRLSSRIKKWLGHYPFAEFNH